MPRRNLAVLLPWLAILPDCAAAPEPESAAPPDAHAYVWSIAADSAGSDGLLVLDVDTASARYGQVIGEAMLGTNGTMPHHIERRVHDGVLFANAWKANRTWIFDVRDPVHPAIRASFGSAEGLAGWAHDFARLPDGRMLVAFNAGPGAYEGAGGLGEVDDNGTIAHVVSARMAGVEDTAATPYVILPVAGRDRAVVGLTEMGMPDQTTFHDTHLLQLWRTDSLAPIAVIPMPPNGTDRGHIWSSSIEATASGEVFTNTFSCGLYRITGLDGDAPAATRVFTFPGGGAGLECGVGTTVGNYWIQAVPAAPGVMVVDLSDPAVGREAARLVMDSTAYRGVHWLSRNGAGTRLAISGNGSWLGMARFDSTTGQIAFDERLGTRDDGAPGITVRDLQRRVMHPHGVAWGR